MNYAGHKYRIYVDGEPITDVSFIAPLKNHQKDSWARKYAESHGISWLGVKFVKVLNGVR